jgi:hypothetical protein
MPAWQLQSIAVIVRVTQPGVCQSLEQALCDCRSGRPGLAVRAMNRASRCANRATKPQVVPPCWNPWGWRIHLNPFASSRCLLQTKHSLHPTKTIPSSLPTPIPFVHQTAPLTAHTIAQHPQNPDPGDLQIAQIAAISRRGVAPFRRSASRVY